MFKRFISKINRKKQSLSTNIQIKMLNCETLFLNEIKL